MSKHTTHFTSDWFSSYSERWLEILGHIWDRPVAALEIGSYEGRSACWLMDNLLVHPKSRLVCVDPWDGNDPCLGGLAKDAEATFDANVAFYGYRVEKVRAQSQFTLPRFMASNVRFDLIFIDGDHKGFSALSDLVMCWQLLAPGGWLAFDDYQWQDSRLRAQPRQAWDAFVSVEPPDLAEVILVGRMMFARRKA